VWEEVSERGRAERRALTLPQPVPMQGSRNAELPLPSPPPLPSPLPLPFLSTHSVSQAPQGWWPTVASAQMRLAIAWGVKDGIMNRE
jgi:hypothetical protein